MLLLRGETSQRHGDAEFCTELGTKKQVGLEKFNFSMIFKFLIILILKF
jgi:hypothetical protein